MILRLKDFVTEQENIGAENPESSPSVSSKKNLKINWLKPDLAKEIEHYDDKAKLEFYQHNITIGNKYIYKT